MENDVKEPVVSGGGDKPRPKWLTPVIAGVCVVVLAAGVGGWRAYEAHGLDVARAACVEAADVTRVNANDYNALLNGKASDVAKVKASEVKDAKTLDVLAEAVKAETPVYRGCTADDKTGLDAATVKLDKQAGWYKSHVKSLEKAVTAVESSKLDKTVDAANALLKSSDGKVADGKTRDELAKAIKARDADAIGKATAAVNASVKKKSDDEAKTKQEAEAKAKAEAEAAAQAAQQAAQSYTPSYSYTSGGYSGYTPSYSYSSGGYGGGYSSGATGGSYSGGSSAGSSSGGSAASSGSSGPVSGGQGLSCDGWACPGYDGTRH